MIDFEKEFDSFTMTGNGGSSIKEIYSLIPSLSQDQLEAVTQLDYFIQKYHLGDLNAIVMNYLQQQRKNKNLSFLKNTTLRNLMKAYTQEEFIRGVKINRQNISQEE